MTLDLPSDSPVLDLPWIITIAPASDEEEWDPIVLGPYERDHALALAEEVVTDEPLIAVVEPVFPHVSAEAIRDEIAVARAAALEHVGDEEDDDTDSDVYDEDDEAGDDEAEDDGDDDGDDDEDDDVHDHAHEHVEVPSAEEVKAGIARVAARLLAEHLAENVN